MRYPMRLPSHYPSTAQAIGRDRQCRLRNHMRDVRMSFEAASISELPADGSLYGVCAWGEGGILPLRQGGPLALPLSRCYKELR